MFSIIIPLYNKENSLKNTIQSVLCQTFSEFEVIVVDDGSTDNSVASLSLINDSRIRIIQQANGGVSSARNRGIKEAKYPYLALLDADDIWDSEYLMEQMRLITDFPEAKMWGCAYGYISKKGKEEIDHLLPLGYRDIISDYFGMKKKTNIFCSSSVVISKQVFNCIDSFDCRIKIGEDLDVWYRIILNSQVVFFNRTLSYYSIDAENKAMQSSPHLQSCLCFYPEKFNKYKKQNKIFKVYFDNYCLRHMFPYYLKQETKHAVKSKLKEISFSISGLRWWIQYMFPNIAKKMLNN